MRAEAIANAWDGLLARFDQAYRKFCDREFAEMIRDDLERMGLKG